jgi:hypothetical protein
MMDDTNVTKEEIKATKAVLDALAELPREMARRVIASVSTLLGMQQPQNPKVSSTISGASGPMSRGSAVAVKADEFEDLASLSAAARPSDGPEKALVVAYWKQVREQLPEWTAQVVNTELKHMGERLPNITGTFNLLRERKPALVVQLKKSGNTRQARKQYKLTSAGIKEVENMLARSEDAGA